MKGKRQAKQSTVMKKTDWSWVWHCIAEVLGLTLLSLAIAMFVLWAFYFFGWVWHSNALLLLSVGVFAFVPPFFFLCRLFTFNQRPCGKKLPSTELRMIIAFFMTCSLVIVTSYAKKYFSANLNLWQITSQTPLNQFGRIGVQQLHVDVQRGVGLEFRIGVVHHYYSYSYSDKYFHGFVLVPIKGRKNDYWGIHTKVHCNSMSEGQMNRYWSDFVKQAQRMITYTYTHPEEAKCLRRVIDDFELGCYRIAIRNAFGRQAEKPFTVWETEENPPTPLTSYLKGISICIGVMLLGVLFILVYKHVRREDVDRHVSFRLWWYEQSIGNRLLLSVPLFLMFVYIIVGEIGGMRLAAEDTEMLIQWGAPTPQLVENGEWWRLILAPFFPYSYSYFYAYAIYFGLYVWHCELRKHPYLLLGVYWVTSVITVVYSMTQSDAGEIVFTLFGGLVGVLGSHWGVFFITILTSPLKEKYHKSKQSVRFKCRNFYDKLLSTLPVTTIFTVITLIMTAVSLISQPFVLFLPIFIAALFGMLIGLIYALFFPIRYSK